MVLVGSFLEHSGGARSLANAVIRVIGQKNINWGMSLIGYIVSIPVFADSGYIILHPLMKVLSSKAGKNIAVTSICLAMGLMASHAMVPPTPGPIATAGIIEANIGLVISLGIVVSLVALIPTIIIVHRIGKNISINHEIIGEPIESDEPTKATPHAGLSFLPILIPILLIVAKSINDYLEWYQSGAIHQVINFLGTPVISLLIALILALLLPEKLSKEMLSTTGWTGKALQDAAIILLITGAGGTFGKVLQYSDLAEIIGNNLSQLSLGIWLPFLIAAAIKTAQGSSTVAMITTASLISPLLVNLGFDTEISLALCVLSIGAGSTVVSHSPDSFFWVVTQLNGMNVSQGYKTHSFASGVLGLSAALIIYILFVLLC